MIVVVFRSRVKPGHDDELNELGARMYDLASRMPGFVSYRDYQATDGEAVAVVEFESLETLKAWREHPEHKAAQVAGRERFFESYRIQVCRVERDYAFP